MKDSRKCLDERVAVFVSVNGNFVQAYTVSSEPNALYSLALAEKKTGHSLDALKHFRAYVADSRPNASAYKVKAREHILELQRVTARLRIEAPKGRVIRVDQTDVGEEQARAGVDVLPGKHHLEAGTEQRDVDVAASQELPVVFTDPVPNAATAPLTQRVVPPPPPPEPPTPAQPTSGSSSGPPVASWVLGAVGVAGLGVGVGFSLAASSKRDDADSLVAKGACRSPSSAECGSAQSAHDDANRNGRIGIAGFAVGGAALVAGGIVWWLSARESRPETHAKPVVVPLITRDTAGAALHMRF